MDRRLRRAWLLFACALAAGTSCEDDADTPPIPTPSPSPVLFTGEARLDGEPFDAEFLGAAVVEQGLVTPCQAEIPPVERGRFAIPVHSSDDGLGCGRHGTEVLFWISTGSQTLWTGVPIAWPEDGRDEVEVEVDFRSSDPEGASLPVTQFHGAVYSDDGAIAPVGTEVEAFIGDARCGRASVRAADSFQGYVISVVGPASIPNCTEGAAIELRVGGEAVDHNPVVNRPPGERDPIDLRRRR